MSTVWSWKLKTKKQFNGPVKLFGTSHDTNLDREIKEELDKIHIPIQLKDLAKTHFKKLKTSTKNWRNVPTKFVQIVGAAGEEDIPESKIKVVTDHYSRDVRKNLNNTILEDPLLSPSADRRIDSIFEDGFHFEYVDAIAFDPATNTHLTKEASDEKFKAMESQFTMVLQQLETWKDSIHLIDAIRDAGGVSLVQGKSGSLISPGLVDLVKGQYPYSVEIIHYSDLGDPIVDIGLTKQIVAVKTNFEDKKICRRDELVYITRNKRGYRKEGKFHGTSPLEPILVISKAIKRIYNYDIPEAVVAAYITKILFNFEDGVDETDAGTFIQNFLKTGKLAFGMSGVNDVKVIQPKVDVQMLDALESKLADVELSIIGVPKSMLNREHNLNRDIATIEAIQFIKFIRKPDEQLLADEFASQLINPLLAIQMGMSLNELPKRIKIVRIQPEKDLDTIFEAQEKLSETKTAEVESQELVQKDATSLFGAAGENGIIVTPLRDGSYGIKRDNSSS